MSNLPVDATHLSFYILFGHSSKFIHVAYSLVVKIVLAFYHILLRYVSSLSRSVSNWSSCLLSLRFAV